MTRTFYNTFALVAAFLLTTAVLAPVVELPGTRSVFAVELA